MLKEKNKGITLIALVITIIVMLVLVGVTIQIAINGGLFENAGEATRKTQNALNAEQQLSNGRIKIGEVWYDSIDDYLKEKPSKDQGINFEELFKTATKHPDQVDTNDIGIAEDGSAVNLDLWLYVLNSDGTSYYLNSSHPASVGSSGYSNLNIVDGKIQGKVPMYIKEDGESDFFPVTDMYGTFYRCTNLTTAPEIPSSVTSLSDTFRDCTNLTTAPEIPSSVTDISSTFYGCTNLTTAPEIPSSVTDISSTFFGCTNLTTAPEIPSSVTSLSYTFRNCTNLTTAPEIPNSVTDISFTFFGCTNLTTAPEIPSSVTDISSTFYGCTNLTGELIINANPTNIGYCLHNAVTGTDCSLVLKGECPRERLIEIAGTQGLGSAPINITIGK